MALIQQTTPQLRVQFALHKARLARHHRDCRCGMYQREACTEQDFVWTAAMNDELERM
jgi:hypothetical protein